jgi:hypothetical protein
MRKVYLYEGVMVAASLSSVLLGDGEGVFSLRLILILSISTQKCFNHRTILYFSYARYLN